MTDIKLITFDLDDTLWEVTPVLVRAEQKAWQRLCEYWPGFDGYFDPASLFEFRRQLMKERTDLKCQIMALRRYTLLKALAHTGCPESQAMEVADRILEEFVGWRHDLECFPEVEPVLDQLAKQYQVGAITNGNADIWRLPVGRFFKFSIKAEDYNSQKPEPLLFLKALEVAGVTAEQTLHVGDCLKADVSGARAVGMKTAWFNPAGKALTEEVEPDYVIRSFSELPACL